MNISSFENCYGCGVCISVCSKQLLHLALNKEGFYSPVLLHKESCTDCGMCISVCAYNHKRLASNEDNVLKSYAIWTDDKTVLRQCSSGGAGFELAKNLILQGYKACGVKYDIKNQRAEHFIANTVGAYEASRGSKYIQSYTVDAFKEFNNTDKYVVTGTPCQIDSLRHYIKKTKREENFVLIDFFCHGVPSMYLWKNYSNKVEKEIGSITSISWRNKDTGWHDSWVMTASSQERNWESFLSKGDLFYLLFLKDVCLNKACYEKCKYKIDQSSADIRIGDLWGTSYKRNDEGVSGVISFTPRGEEILTQLKNNCTVKEETLSVVTEGQMTKSPKKPFIRGIVIRGLEKGQSLEYIYYVKIAMYLIFEKIKRKVNG